MRRLRFLSCVLSAVTLLSFTFAAPAQDGAAGKDVTFGSADRVQLKGKFYAGKDGQKSATVVMLHALGEDSSKADWTTLAKELNKRGYAVLTFDFRGHGDSTRVLPGTPNANPQQRIKGFWDETDNIKYYKGYNPNQPRKEEIDFKSFNPQYARFLVNDLAAVQAFLDERNDAGECNSGAIILIGAKDGGSLGAIWMNAEWHRMKFTQTNPLNPSFGVADLQNPEGQSIVAAVFLSLSETLGGNRLNIPGILNVPVKVRSTPVAFFYGEQDEKGKKVAVAAEKLLKDKTKNTFLGKVPIPKTDLSGRLLLTPALGTTTAIGDYVDNVLKGKTFTAKNRVQKDDVSIWQWQTTTGATTRFIARPKGYTGNVFFPYDAFIKYAQ